MSEVNIPLLRKAVEWAEAEAAKPAELCEWVQADYRVEPARAQSMYDKAPGCGTCYCIAGFVGAQLDARYTQKNLVDGVHVNEFAAKALGINLTEADNDLFHEDNTIEDVRRIAEELAGERL